MCFFFLGSEAALCVKRTIFHWANGHIFALSFFMKTRVKKTRSCSGSLRAIKVEMTTNFSVLVDWLGFIGLAGEGRPPTERFHAFAFAVAIPSHLHFNRINIGSISFVTSQYNVLHVSE